MFNSALCFFEHHHKEQPPGKEGANKLYRASQVARRVQPDSSPQTGRLVVFPFPRPLPSTRFRLVLPHFSQTSLLFFSQLPGLGASTALSRQVAEQHRANNPAKRSAEGGYAYSNDTFKVVACMTLLLHAISQSHGRFPSPNSDHHVLLSCASALLCFKENSGV